LEGSGKPDYLILSGIYQLLVCTDNVNILDGTVCIAGNRENFLFAIKVIGLEAYVDKTQYMVMSGDLNGRRSYNIKADNSSFEKMDWFRY
jgi:hypothetical protein